MSETRIVECRIPVFVAAADPSNADEANLWYGAKYTIASSDMERKVDYVICAAYDNTGEYYKGERYPVNASQLVVTSRSDNPALAELKMKSLDWETYTRPERVQIVYEEKRGVSMEVTISLGLLCNKITTAAQERSTNPLSTLIFSPAETKAIDEERRSRGEPIEVEGYKRYTGVITVPYGDRKVKNAVTGLSLPGASTGPNADTSGYNITTDLFFANIYVRQVSNNIRALKAGEHVGFLTFKFTTTFSGYRGPVNSTLVSIGADKIANHVCYPMFSMFSKTDLGENYETENVQDDIIVKGPCRFVERKGVKQYVGDRMRVPLSNGLFAMVKKPAGMEFNSPEMRKLFADTWKRRKDPLYGEYEKAVEEIRMRKAALKAIRKDFRAAKNDEEENSLSTEYDTVSEALAKAERRLTEVMRTDLAMITEASRKKPLVTADKNMQIMKPVAGGDEVKLLAEISEGEVKSHLRFDKTVKFRYEGREYNSACQTTEFGNDSIASAFFDVNGDSEHLIGMHVGTSMVLPAIFPYMGPSAAIVGGGFCVDTVNEIYGDYNGSKEIKYEGQLSFQIATDTVPAEISATNDYTMTLKNMFPTPYTRSDEEFSMAVSGCKIGICAVDTKSGESAEEYFEKKMQARGRKELERTARLMATSNKMTSMLYAAFFRQADMDKEYESEIVECSTNTLADDLLWTGPLLITSPYTLTTAAGNEGGGLFKIGVDFEVSGYSCFFIHAKKGDGSWWSPGATGEILDRRTILDFTTLTLEDLSGEKYFDVTHRVYCSDVPLYSEQWASRCVRMSTAEYDWEDATAYYVALGDDFSMEYDGEVRKGGVMIQLIGHESVDRSVTVTLPKEMPDGKGGKVPVTDSTKFHFYHVIDTLHEICTDQKTFNTGDWSISYTFIQDMPYRVPNLAGSKAGRRAPLRDVVVDTPPATISHFHGSAAYFGGPRVFVHTIV